MRYVDHKETTKKELSNLSFKKQTVNNYKKLHNKKTSKTKINKKQMTSNSAQRNENRLANRQNVTNIFLEKKTVLRS